MLRLAFTRPVRVLPPLARWQRFKSDGTVIPPSESPSTAQSSSRAGDVVKPQKVTSENAVELELSGLSIETQSRWEEEAQREFELAGVTEDQLSASIRSPPKLAETETELFGSTSQQDGENTMLDPKTLPRRVHLDPSVAQFTELEYASALVHGRGSIHFRSHHPKLLDLFTHFATHAAYSLGIPVSIPYTLPTQRTLWTVLRSPFVHKKSQENFERRVHKRGIKAWDADPEVIDRWFKYLRRHAIGGVGMRMTKWERMPLGVGATRLAHVDDRLGGPDLADSAKIKALGDKIVMDELSSVRKPDLTVIADKE